MLETDPVKDEKLFNMRHDQGHIKRTDHGEETDWTKEEMKQKVLYGKEHLKKKDKNIESPMRKPKMVKGIRTYNINLMPSNDTVELSPKKSTINKLTKERSHGAISPYRGGKRPDGLNDSFASLNLAGDTVDTKKANGISNGATKPKHIPKKSEIKTSNTAKNIGKNGLYVKGKTNSVHLSKLKFK